MYYGDYNAADLGLTPADFRDEPDVDPIEIDEENEGSPLVMDYDDDLPF